jgi:EmrB/QacA subfamily drug resistance transporter
MDTHPGYDKRWWTLVVLVLSLVIVVVGNTVLNVALPTLVRELDASSSALQWMVDSYALVFAGLLLTAGALGDRYGRKGALQIGLVIFGAASVVSAFATEPSHLIITRAVMGVGAALVMPATLSILTWVFPPQERGKAIGIWAGFAGAGAAIGPIAGGWMLEHFWWGSVFLLNVPIVLIALVAGKLIVPTSRDPEQAALDPVGAVLSIVSLTTLVYAIIEGPNFGWSDPLVIASFAIAALTIGAFIWWELRIDNPMLDLRMTRDPRFSAASIAIMFVFFAMFGVFFLMTQYLQIVLGYTPFESGLRTLPMAFGMVIAAPSGARLVERIGSKRVVGMGLVIVSIGLLLASRLHVDTSYSYLMVALLVTAVGMGFTAAPSTASIMASMPLRKAGVGSAVNDTTRELGGALGVAVLGSIAVSHYSSALHESVGNAPTEVMDAASKSVGAAVHISEQLGSFGLDLSQAAKVAFTEAMDATFIIAAIVSIAAAVVVWRYLPHRVAHGEGHPVPSVGDAVEVPVASA